MSQPIFGPAAQKLVRKRYYRRLLQIVNIKGLDPASIAISEQQLAAACAEAAKDIDIICLRRGRNYGKPFRGLSKGKLAGVIAYRLARYRIVHIQGDMVDDAKINDVQDLSAILLAVNDILKCSPPLASLRELVYMLNRRHVNQEMLATCFDLFLDRTMDSAAG